MAQIPRAVGAGARTLRDDASFACASPPPGRERTGVRYAGSCYSSYMPAESDVAFCSCRTIDDACAGAPRDATRAVLCDSADGRMARDLPFVSPVSSTADGLAACGGGEPGRGLLLFVMLDGCLVSAARLDGGRLGESAFIGKPGFTVEESCARRRRPIGGRCVVRRNAARPRGVNDDHPIGSVVVTPSDRPIPVQAIRK